MELLKTIAVFAVPTIVCLALVALLNILGIIISFFVYLPIMGWTADQLETGLNQK